MYVSVIIQLINKKQKERLC